MTPDDIIDAFSSRTFPSEAIAACRADKETSSQILLNLLEDFLKGAFDDDSDASQHALDAIFLGVHMLAEFREKRAFHFLMRFLGGDQDLVDEVLGEAITSTLPGIIISTFDGNLDELHQLIGNVFVDEYVRSSALEALAYLTTEGTIPRESTQQFLKECFNIFRNEPPCFAWIGWTECIAVLGMEALVPLVEQAFRDGAIDSTIMEFSHFQNDLRYTLGLQTTHPQLCTRRTPFDNVDDMSSWIMYAPEKDITTPFPDISLSSNGVYLPPQSNTEQRVNPYRNVGRNDPCPCGSGKKFKKCCLQ